MKRPIRLYLVIAGAIFLVLFLIGSGLQDTMVYYVTVKELKLEAQNYTGQGLRINGTVVEESLIEKNGTSFEFAIREGEDEMLVKYDGILPDTFKENHDVLIEGRYLGNGTFQAEQVFTKCASKYDAESEHPIEIPQEET